MVCDRCTEVVIRKRDGRRLTVFRCADPGSPLFTQDVTEETCRPCSSYQEAKAAQAAIPEVPSLAKRVKSWTAAVADWKVKGSPERSEEEVQRIFNTFCAATPHCSWYDPDRQLCRGCGCRVRSEGMAVFNKIRMATQHCPRDLW
jgi:hypothetical protein